MARNNFDSFPYPSPPLLPPPRNPVPSLMVFQMLILGLKKFKLFFYFFFFTRNWELKFDQLTSSLSHMTEQQQEEMSPPSKGHRLDSNSNQSSSQNLEIYKEDYKNDNDVEPESKDELSTSTTSLPPSELLGQAKSLFTSVDFATIVVGEQNAQNFTGTLTSDFNCQCDDLLVEKDVGVQVVISADMSVQTDDPEPYTQSEFKEENEEFDSSSSLSKFLSAVTPTMIEELKANIESNAFDDYIFVEKTAKLPSVYLHSLTFPFSIMSKQIAKQNRATKFGGDYDDDKDDDKFNANANANANLNDEGGVGKGLAVTDVAWSAGGSTLIASYGGINKTGWCDSKGFVVAWNLSDRKFDPLKPSSIIEWSSHVTCVAAHPEKPSIFCAGSFNGEILVIDVNNTASPLLASSKIDDYFHREPIKKLCWSFEVNDHDWQLNSVSGDGKILWWQIEKMKCPTRGVRLTSKIGSSGSDGASACLVGGNAMASGGKNNDQLYVGSEGGQLFRVASRDFVPQKPPKANDLEMKWSTSALQALLRVPAAQREEISRKIERKAKKDKRRGVDLAAVYNAKVDASVLFPNKTDFNYENHIGPVNSLDISPFHRKLLASGGNDGELRIYDSLGKSPVLTFEPGAEHGGGSIESCMWSKTRPCVLGSCDDLGNVYLYDLQKDDCYPVATLHPCENVTARGGEGKVEESEEEEEEGKKAIANFYLENGSRRGSCRLHSLAFNDGKNRKLLAAGDHLGVVHIWRLPDELSEVRRGEEEWLKVYFAS